MIIRGIRRTLRKTYQSYTLCPLSLVGCIKKVKPPEGGLLFVGLNYELTALLATDVLKLPLATASVFNSL